MTIEKEAPHSSGGQWDSLVEELQALRKRAGNPSFQRITDLIVEARVAAGAPEAAARIARSSVYDTFRVGRTRVNLDLTREVALVLGATSEQVDGWVARSEGRVLTHPEASSIEEDRPPRWWKAPLLMVVCLTINLIGREFVDFFHFPIYLDMVGTAIAAIALGPWRGAAVGASTNIIGAIGSGFISIPFGIVNVAGALMWGYGVRRFGMGRTLPRFFVLNVMTAFVCTCFAVPVIVLFLGGDLRTGHDLVTQLVEESIDTFIVALGFSNLLTSTADKLISGFVALVVVTALPWRMRRGIPLVMADHRQ